MDWHARYTAQAAWTRDLRAYLFQGAGLPSARRVMEAGCGTGAVLSELPSRASLHGLDISLAMLEGCGKHVPAAIRACGDVLALPYADETFDIVYCHFLLLWVDDPVRALREMKRVTRPGGHVLALAEPDYTSRVDQPAALEPLGRWQADALRRQGADPGIGAQLARTFYQAGLDIVETGTIRARGMKQLSPAERQSEWAVLESDLGGFIPAAELARMKAIDEAAWQSGERILYVPTFFAWARA